MIHDSFGLTAQLQAAQRELAIIMRDAIYKTDALAYLAYEVLPRLYASLEAEGPGPIPPAPRYYRGGAG